MLSALACLPIALAVPSSAQTAATAAATAKPAQATPELPTAEQAQADQLREDMRRMVSLARDRVFPALVNIEVITVQYWGGKERKGRATGSGTIISPEGYVLTNYHVVENGLKFTCTLADKQEITAKLVGEDPLTDLAVLKLDLTKLADPETPLPFAAFGDSDELEIGDTVMAMGSPWALSRSVTRGSVSNTERILSGDDDDAGEMRFDRDQRTGIFNRWIQHDAPISPGNSGGPLVNLRGEVIGVNTRGNSSGGDMAFAIPSNVARAVAGALIEHNEVPRSWYGWSLKSIKRTGWDNGVLVNSVVDGAPASNAGIQAGDLVLEIDGKPVTIRYPEQIPPLLKDMADRPVGSPVKIALRRDGKRQETTITTDKMLPDRGDEAAFRGWGISGQDITEQMARARRLESTQGVLVSGVRSGSPAATAELPISYGDVLRAVGGEPIENLEALVARYDEIMSKDPLPEYLLIEFDRRGKNQITLIEPRPDKDEDPPREVPKAWIGIATQPVLKQLAEQMGNPDAVGFRVTRVYPRTKAAQSGLAVGDIVTALNKTPLEPRTKADIGLFDRQVKRLSIGDEATLTVLRETASREIAVALERTRIEPGEARTDRNEDFELTVRELTFFDRDENRWDEEVRGVLVGNVESVGWAGLAGLRFGDLIQRIGDHPVRGLKSYRKAMEAIAEEQPERVVFLVLRGVVTRFQFAEPDWKPQLADEATADEGDESKSDSEESKEN